MSEEQHRKDVVDLVRACLLSSKGGVCLDQINKDYRDLVGENIPYRKLGHSNLADFFSKARDVCRLMESNGRIIVHPVATEATTHIDNLVTHQKKASTSSRGQKRGRFSSQHHSISSGQAGRRPNQRSNWVPPVNNHVNAGAHPRGGGGGGRRPQRTQKVGSGRLPPRSSIANSTYRPYTSHQKLRTPSSNPSFNANTNNSASNANTNANANHSNPPTGNNMNNNNNTNSNNANAYPLKIGTFHSGKPQNHYPRSSKASKNNAANPPPSAPERSYVKDLTQYFKDKELGTTPEFKTSEMGSKKMRHRTYVSSVTVEGRSFRTFPVEYNSKELAEEAAALLAIEALGLKDKSQKQTNEEESTLRQAGEINSLIADRIAEIVGDKWNGIWSTQVDVEYKAKYKEVLPPDWPRLIIPSKHRLRIDIPIENHYIVLPMKNNDEEEGREKAETTPSMNGKSDATPDAQNEFTTPPSNKTLDNVEEMMTVDGHFSEKTLPPINISDETYWDVYITLVSSPTDVVVRLLSESHYDDLTTDMELYYYDYSSKLLPVNEPVVGCLYAAKLDTDWHRVRVTNVHGIKVTCYFIDHGDEDVLSVQDLRPIHPKFLRLPPQALPVKLAGLENLADDEMALSYVRENILGRSLVAEVVSREKGIEPTLILFDTSTETDININKKVLELANEGNNFNGCALPSPGEEISSAYLLSVSSTGDCYVQRDSVKLIDDLIDEAKDKILEAELPTNLDTNKLYLARSQISNQLCRAALLTTQVKEGKVEVTCVDHGNQEKVDLNDLREIGSVSKPLIETPHQAFKCRLANLPANYVWTREAADKLRSLIPEEKQFSLKVISTSGDIPEVEIYLKEQEKEGDAESINSMISQLKDLFIVNDDHDAALERPESGKGINSEESKTSLSPQDELLFSEIASLKGLVPPKIPEKDEYFDVTVTLAASPSNFYVQPWRQTESLEILTSEINEFYSSPSRRVNSITMDDLSKDSFFAAFHSDGFWYRIKVDRILDDQNITVKFVDYGDFTMVNLKNLQPLWPQFRNLPMQAIKAFLSDIVPVNGDWTPDDAIWFSNRSVEKQFVSVVKDISHEEDGSIKLGVSLIDVSHPKEDILIDKLLVDEKRAVYLCI